MLFAKAAPGENLVVRGARVLDPAGKVDGVLDVRVDGGMIAELGSRLDPNSHRVVEAEGLTLAPGFVDPHVHLRTPGREDEETIASGTQAAAAGGYCAILAMPDTDPVVDSAAVLGSLAETAEAEAEVPVGFLAAISKGLEGGELAELGFAGYPSVAESLMVERDLSLAAYEGRPVHLLHLSARESVKAVRNARASGVQATAEVTPHHLCLTDEAVRSLDSNLKMNPPLRSREDRAALIDALRDGTIGAIATDHAPHARHEKEVPFEAAPFG